MTVSARAGFRRRSRAGVSALPCHEYTSLGRGFTHAPWIGGAHTADRQSANTTRRCPLQFLLLINGSPEARAAAAALRFARAMISGPHAGLAVFFNQAGVRHAHAVGEVDGGGEIPHERWPELARDGGFPLLVCRAAWARRSVDPLPAGWQASSLAELADLMERADRVVTFGAAGG